jgi:DNA-3-methyladenine glycosylase II
MQSVSLTRSSLVLAAKQLATGDRVLRAILEEHGPPPLWSRPQGFPTLVKIILEQQVSLASAASMFARLEKHIVPFKPEQFLVLRESGLRALGLTRQKTAYLLHLSDSILNGSLKISRLARMKDADARAALIQLKGIGSWSADIYLLMALRRPDVWPSGDLALALSIARLRKLAAPPKPEALTKMAERWRPYRSVAARMLWQSYLAQRRQK